MPRDRRYKGCMASVAFVLLLAVALAPFTHCDPGGDELTATVSEATYTGTIEVNVTDNVGRNRPGCGHVVDQEDPSGPRDPLGHAKSARCNGEALPSGQPCLRGRVPCPEERPSRRRAQGGRKMHRQKLALIEAPFPEPDGMERNRHNDVGRRHARTEGDRSGQAGQVARDRCPAPVLERVYRSTCRSPELERIEHPRVSARIFSRTGRLGHGERPGSDEQLGPARCAEMPPVGRKRRGARHAGIREQEREEDVPEEGQESSPGCVRLGLERFRTHGSRSRGDAR